MDVHKAISQWNDEHGWPDQEVRIGPYACGIKPHKKARRKCQKLHAYAEARSEWDAVENRVRIKWHYVRPCDVHYVEKAEGIPAQPTDS